MTHNVLKIGKNSVKMATLKIKLPYISYTQGADKPRFEPGPSVRALGFKGKNLRHANGQWFTQAETLTWVKTLQQEISDRRTLKQEGVKLPALKDPRIYSLSDLIEDLFKHHRTVRNSPSRTARKISDGTVRTYRGVLRIAQKLEPDVFASDARAFTRKHLKALHTRLWQAKSLSTANVMMAVIRSAYTHAVDEEKIITNPALELQLPKAEGVIRTASVDEITAFIAAADRLGYHGVGDAILLGVHTAQRISDRLKLKVSDFSTLFKTQASDHTNRMFFDQKKTDKMVIMPQSAALKQRLEAAKARHSGTLSTQGFVIINSDTGKPYGYSTYTKHFKEALAEAIKGDAASGIAPCPNLYGFTDRDLRDTAVTWLANSGATLPEICAITGHSLKSVEVIAKSYLQMNTTLADNAVRKLEAYLAKP